MSDAPLSEAEYRAELARTMTEEQLQRAVLGCAEFLGWRVYHTHDSRRSQAGFPDLVLVHALQQRVIFAELKRENGRLRPEQIRWLEDLTAAALSTDVEVELWRPSDWHSGAIERSLQKRERGDTDG